MFPFVDCIITHGNHFVNTFLKFFCNFFVTNYEYFVSKGALCLPFGLNKQQNDH